MSKIFNYFMIILSALFFLMFVIAFVLYLNGVRGAVSFSPDFRTYLGRVIADTGQSTIGKIQSVSKLGYNGVNNFWDFILNVGKVIVNLFVDVVNVFIYIWNLQVTIITFFINIFKLFFEIRPNVFEIDNNAWWWRSIGH